jgi:hypothetical protein
MDKNKLRNNVFNEIIKYAVDKKLSEPPVLPVAEAPDPSVDLTPSFSRRMNYMFNGAQRRRSGKRLLKAGAIAAIVIIVFSTVIFSVEAFRVPVLNYFKEFNQSSITIKVIDNNVDYKDFNGSIEGLYLPSYMPENYWVESIEPIGSSFRATFFNGKDKIVLKKLLSGASIGIDNEDATAESITLFDHTAEYYETERMSTLIFQIDDTSLMLTGQVPRDELFKIAESISRKN